MSLLRPYQAVDVDQTWIAKQLGITEENKKIQNMYKAVANPGEYIEEREDRLSKVSKTLSDRYVIYKKLLEDLPDEKANRLLTEIMKSQFSVEKALIDNDYSESDVLLFKGLEKNLTPKEKYVTEGGLNKYKARLEYKAEKAARLAEVKEKKKALERKI